jgi:hypothetical protein
MNYSVGSQCLLLPSFLHEILLSGKNILFTTTIFAQCTETKHEADKKFNCKYRKWQPNKENRLLNTLKLLWAEWPWKGLMREIVYSLKACVHEVSQTSRELKGGNFSKMFCMLAVKSSRYWTFKKQCVIGHIMMQIHFASWQRDGAGDTLHLESPKSCKLDCWHAKYVTTVSTAD